MSSGRRTLTWLELGVGGLGLVVGTLAIGLGMFTGHHDPHHGGTYPILFGSLLAGIGACFLVAGLALRGRKPSGWYLQLFPVTAVGWILWDILSH